MKRVFSVFFYSIIVVLLCSIKVSGQTITDTGTLRSVINTQIVTNGQRLISASELNRILNGVLNTLTPYGVDSLSYDSTVNQLKAYRYGASTITIQLKTTYSGGGGGISSIGMVVPQGFVVSPASLSANGTFTITDTMSTGIVHSGSGILSSSQIVNADVHDVTWSKITGAPAFITLTGLSATSPIQYNNTTGVISELQGSSTQNGFISTTDWSNFNAKQSPITWQSVTTGSSKVTLGGTPSGSVFSPFSIDVNESNLTLSNMGGTLGIGHGGTNATTQTGALNNLLPAQSGGTVGFSLVSNGTNATWVSVSGGGTDSAISVLGPITKSVSGTNITIGVDTSVSGTSFVHLATQNMLRFINNLESVDSINSVVYQNNNLIGSKILQLQIGGITIPQIPTGNSYYTFNSTTGAITLQNDSFYVGDHIYIVYRQPFIDSIPTGTIGTIANVNSFNNIAFFHNNSPANAFSITGTQVLKRSLSGASMWTYGGDAIDYPLVNTCDEQGYFQITYRIGVQGNGLGMGIKFGPGQNDGGAGSYGSIYSNLNISVLTVPKLYTWNQQNIIDSATFPGTIALGDSIKMIMTRNKGQFITKVTDLNTSVTVSDTAIFNYTYPGNFIIPASGRWGIAGFGTGIDTVRTLTIGSNSIVNPKVIFLGDSKTAGYYATAQNLRYGEQVGANSIYQPYAIYADPGDRTIDCLANIPYIIQYVKPKYVFLNIGRNDLNSFGVPFCSSCQTNYENIVSRLEGAGIKVFHVLPIPESLLVQTSINTFITTFYGTANTIDPSIGFVTGTMLAGDGVHPNASGHTTVATNFVNAMKLIY